MSIIKFNNRYYKLIPFIVILLILSGFIIVLISSAYNLHVEQQNIKNVKPEPQIIYVDKPSSETTQSQPFFLTQEQLPLLNDEFLQILNEEQVKNILPETIPKMKWVLLKTKTHFLTKEQLQYLSQYSPKFLGDYIPYNFFNHHESFVKMSPENLPLIPPLGLSQVKPQTYNQLSKEQIQAFTTEQLKTIFDFNYSELTPAFYKAVGSQKAMDLIKTTDVKNEAKIAMQKYYTINTNL
ncbi:hypothetical protein [Candidatus Phytoplasma pruni]|uniref:Uncharacterized protein n=1 Tax=Candidatus Phytoplasma pruni TaxID=479893 RepID=A0A851HJ54_9MOLU|nr:hypothetical protein [Candidatus Phytoplasma pruni]NWN45576.1 hypothetical protein [Candidatus Phytoplasma pruni]